MKTQPAMATSVIHGLVVGSLASIVIGAGILWIIAPKPGPSGSLSMLDQIAYALVILGVGTYVGFFQGRKRLRRLQRDKCGNCGCDLTCDDAPECPECGTAVEQPQATP
jgi:hypothetical protein